MIKLDVFKRAPRDITEGSYLGASLTIVAFLAAIALISSEWQLFREVRISSEMTIPADSDATAKVQVNLNISFPKIPCDYLSFDAQDAMGNRNVDAKGHLFKHRLNSAGAVLGTADAAREDSVMLPFIVLTGAQPAQAQAALERLEAGEGCRVEGSVTVNRAPGHLHISAHPLGFNLQGVKDKLRSVAHFIHHLSFGALADLGMISKFPATGALTPLDGRSHFSDLADVAVFEYYLKVVATQFGQVQAFQFAASETAVVAGFLPSLYLRYDFSPVRVRFSEVRESLLTLIVRLLAIVGGLFSVMGVVNAVLSDSVRTLKLRVNKLG